MKLNVQTKETRKFELTDEAKQKLTYEMVSVLNKYDWEPTYEACAAIVDKWAEDKAPLIEVLQNHPNWVADKFQVVFNKTFNRVTDEDAVNHYLSWLYDFFRENCLTKRTIDGHDKDFWLNRYYKTRSRSDWDKCMSLSDHPYEEESTRKLIEFNRMIQWFRDNKTAKVDEEGASLMNELYPDVIRAKEGMKTSRLMHKICTGVYKLGEIWDERTRYRSVDGKLESYKEKYRPFNSMFCKYADAINPIEYQMHTIISVNPIDYLTMSIGNSWTSCHGIDLDHEGDGYNACYCGGTLSYMLDSVSAVTYTVKNTYTGRDFELEEKVNRQMIHYKDGIMIQGRLYPQNCDYGCNDQYKVWREIEEATFAEALGMPNLWKYKKTNSVGEYVTSKGVHYRDYTSYDTCGTCRISVDDGVFRGDWEDPNGEYDIMTIGHAGLDIYFAGEQILEENTLTKRGRPDEDFVFCSHCGDRISRDDAIEYEGEYYCCDCIGFCNYFRRYIPYHMTEFTYVRGMGDVCEDALTELMKRGEVKCDDYTGYYYLVSIYPGGYDEDGNWHSNNTLRTYFVIPEGGDKYIRKGNAVEYEGKWYRLEDCITCSECGQIFPKVFDNERHICLDCLHERRMSA